LEKNEPIQKLKEEICLNDCQKSFTRLFDLLYAQLFEISKYYVKVNHLAEEVVMDVFLKFWNSRKMLLGVQDLKSYFFTAIKRQSLNALRDNKKNHMFIDSLELQTIVELKNPESDLFTKEFLEYFACCINNLPEKCRIVFKLVKEEDLKYKEVAEILNISEKTVEMHMGLAFKQLRNDLGIIDKKIKTK
jgi:RNA polymerase sigma-70 factor (family 1)